jgi:hypothetical protein
VNQAISPHILEGIDLDHDGYEDDWNVVNNLYWRGTERFLDQVRQALGSEIVILANDAPLFYASRLNGREYENKVRSIAEGRSDWTRFRWNYEQWMLASRSPRLTMVMGNPPGWLEAKYELYPYAKMSPAMEEAASAYYREMRFSLTTALMEGGLYGFEFGSTWHGNAWWYDEYDGAGRGKGYLGAPLGEAYNALGPLASANTVHDPGFEVPGLPDWALVTSSGAQATLGQVLTTTSYAGGGTNVARTDILATGQIEDVRVTQGGLDIVNGRRYTLSFWGKADRQLWNVKASVHDGGSPWNRYGLNERIEVGTAWQHFTVPFTATTSSSSAAVSVAMGHHPGTVWIDQVALQEGELATVFRRDFEYGVALCNATTEAQTVSLGGTYRKLSGAQAPLVQIILDDVDATTPTFEKIGGWAGVQAGDDEWGDTYHYSLGTINPDGFIGKAIWRPDIPRAGAYTAYVWVAPHAKCDAAITYEVAHAGGVAPAVIDPRVSEPMWVRLGTYPFAAGTGNRVTLLNLTDSTWVVADAVKFESVARYNDGAAVDSVTLAGQDGIILVNYRDLPIKMYLPLMGKRG